MGCQQEPTVPGEAGTRGDRLGEARALYALAGAYDVQGQPKQALNFYQQALEIRQAVGDRRSKAQALNAVGTAYAALSQPETALGYYRQAVALYAIDREPESRFHLVWHGDD